MKRWFVFFAAMALTVFPALTVTAARADMDGPYVYKNSVRLSTRKQLRYWPNPNAKEPTYNTNAWTPRIEFYLMGPLEGGSQLSVTFTKPSGAKWFTDNLPTAEIPAGQTTQVRYETDDEKKGTTEAGQFGVTVNLTNALTNTKKTLFTGKFLVGKFYYGPKAASSPKDSADFYVNHDWSLPLGQMYFDSRIDEEAPQLVVLMWFRGATEDVTTAGYLFKDGKQISSTKTNGTLSEMGAIDTGTGDPAYRYGLVQLRFANIAAYYKQISANSYPNTFFLDKNPGVYEIKVLKNGKLARTARFTIGADGKLADSDLAEKNKMGLGVILLPVTVSPGIDGKANVTNYKTNAYYSNPVVGFP